MFYTFQLRRIVFRASSKIKRAFVVLSLSACIYELSAQEIETGRLSYTRTGNNPYLYIEHFPNPVLESCTIKINGLFSINPNSGTCRVVDLLGRTVADLTPNYLNGISNRRSIFTVQLGHLKTGVYKVVFSVQNFVKSKRIVVF